MYNFSHGRCLTIATLAVLVVDPTSLAADEHEHSGHHHPDTYSAGQLVPSLRAQVEQLKRDVAREATNEESMRQRASVLWKWANAVAADGGTLPVHLPTDIAFILAYPAPEFFQRAYGPQKPRPSAGGGPLAALDRYVRELAVRDEQPGAIGPLTSDNQGPFVAESFHTIRQTYRVGTMPMFTGGGLMLAKHYLDDHGEYQTSDPQAADYITVTSSNPHARFVPFRHPVSGMHGGLFAPTRNLAFRLEGANLDPGDTVTVTYGDTSQGSPGYQVQSYTNDGFQLPLYIDLEAKGNYFTLPMVPYRVVGKPVKGVHGFAPSVVAAGEKFEISVRSEDEYYNRATGPIPAYQVLVNGQHHTTIPAGDQAITILDDLQFDEPGVYRVSFVSDDKQVVGVANPILVENDPGLRIYWGETHGHCGFAEGQGTPDGFMRFGRDDARLDFLTHSEHDIFLDDHEWEVLKANVEKYKVEGKFIPILGYEWTARMEIGGHHNVLFRSTKGRRRAPLQEAHTLSQLYHQLQAQNDMRDVLVIPHAHEPGDYRESHPHMEHLVEIMSMHGRFEWFGRMYLRHGHQVGFVGGSDDHLSHPGYASPRRWGMVDTGGLAAVFAPSKSSDAIFDGLKSISTYATTGKRIILRFAINGESMGRRAEFARRRQLRGRVIGTSPIESITIAKNEGTVWTKEFATAVAPQRHVLITFASPSQPLIRDSPRPWRPWIGALRVKQAKLLGVSTPSFLNRRVDVAKRHPTDDSRVDFVTWTRGSEKSIVLEVDDASQAEVEVMLEETIESPNTPAKFRGPAALPAEHFTLSMGSGKSIHEMPVDGRINTVTLRPVDPTAPAEQTFEIVDEDDPRLGDYYYVRVKQLDGAEAWSSPVWVGGTPPM